MNATSEFIHAVPEEELHGLRHIDLKDALPSDGHNEGGKPAAELKLRVKKKEKNKTARHKPDSLSHAITIAWCDWIAGLVIGLMPLLCHLLLHFAARSAPDWDDNWSPDLLFITISNSGLVAVTVFTRMLGAHLSVSSLTPSMRIVWGLTIVCFALASMLYGAAVTGMSNHFTGWAALGFVVFSAYCSLNFELAVAREHFVPKRSHRRIEPHLADL